MNFSSPPRRHWLLYDGQCPMCRRCASWIKRYDTRDQFIAAPAASAPAAPDGPMTPQLREACESALHVVTARGEILRGGRAVLFAFSRILNSPLRRWASGLSRAPWIWPIEIAYALVAKNRMRVGRFVLPNEPVTVPERFDDQ